ncbi:MAG: hypothetical protein QXU95_03390 [Candidatus Bathyarchaeia archaeon]
MSEEVIPFLEKLKEVLDERQEYNERIIATEIIDQLWSLPSRMNEVKSAYDDIIETAKELNVYEKCFSLLEGIRKDLENKLQILEEFLDDCKTPENILENMENSKRLLELAIENIRSLEEGRSMLAQADYELNKLMMSSLAFQGRRGVDSRRELSTLSEKIRSTKTFINEITNHLDDVENVAKNILSRSVEPLGVESKTFSRDYIYLLNQLEAAIRRGIYSWQLIEILTGLKNVTGDLGAGNIAFKLEEYKPKEESPTTSIDELFYRHPPFEPIAEKRMYKVRGTVSLPIAGNFVWFINSDNFDYLTKDFIERKWEGKSIIEGASVRRGNYEEIVEVKPIDILRVEDGELTIKIIGERLEGRRFYVRMKYGSRNLADLFKRETRNFKIPITESLEKEIQELYERKIGRTGKAYRFNDLTYVWYCYLGYAMSMDPWDSESCPFKNECYKGRMITDKRCPFWSYSRRIFPKVFSVIERNILGLERLHKLDKVGPLIPLEGKGVNVQEIYKGVQWNMPANFGSGAPVVVNFKRALVKPLPRTNIVGFVIPYSIVGAMILELIDPENVPKSIVKINDELTQTLDKLVLSKYFIWKVSERGMRTFSFFTKSKEKIIKEYKEFISALTRQEEIIEFCANVLTHTLAHLLHSFLVKELELQNRDLMYLTHVDKEKDSLYVIIAENSPLGVIDIVQNVKEKFGGVSQMLIKFVDEITNMLSIHGKENEMYLEEAKRARERYLSTQRGSNLKEVMERIKEYYSEFVNNGLILDLYGFSLHLHLNEVYYKISRDTKVDSSIILDELRDILQFIGPSHCVDGCTSCIMMESGCITPISQNLELSRYLASLFLGFFFKGDDFIGKRIGEVLLRRLPNKSIFAVSPFLDEEGIGLLKEISQRGIEVSLVTKENTYDKYVSELANIKDVYITNIPRHEKSYIIDDAILINTTWNLTIRSSSTNRFEIKMIRPVDVMTMKQQILMKSKRKARG